MIVFKTKMEKFRSRKICKFFVILEMILAGASIFLAVGLFFARVAEPGLEDDEESFAHLPKPIPKPKTTPKLILFALQIIGISHFVLMILVFFAGQRVLSESCYLSPHIMDIHKIKAGISACGSFCTLELIRLVLVIAAFLGELLVLNVAMILLIFAVATNLPIIFGWFFTSEFRKELKIHEEELIAADNLSRLPPSYYMAKLRRENETSSSTSPEGQNDNKTNEERQCTDAMMYSTPAIAHCINSLAR